MLKAELENDIKVFELRKSAIKSNFLKQALPSPVNKQFILATANARPGRVPHDPRPSLFSSRPVRDFFPTQLTNCKNDNKTFR